MKQLLKSYHLTSRTIIASIDYVGKNSKEGKLKVIDMAKLVKCYRIKRSLIVDL